MRLLHASLIISDIQTSIHFYEEILGLERDIRPNLAFEGLFYKLSGGQQLHLMKIDNPYHHSIQPKHGGRDRHLAFGVDSVQKLADRLEHSGITFTRSQSDRAALFCHDPSGNVIELCERV